MTRKLFGIEIDGDSDPLTADAVQRACALGLLQSHGSVAVYDLTPEWVSVEERLPVPGEKELWVVIGLVVRHAYYVAGQWWDEESRVLLGVTHWQPIIIPEPPA